MVRFLSIDISLIVFLAIAVLNGCSVDVEKEMAAIDARRKAARSLAKEESPKVASLKENVVEAVPAETVPAEAVPAQVDSVKEDGESQVFEDSIPVDSVKDEFRRDDVDLVNLGSLIDSVVESSEKVSPEKTVQKIKGLVNVPLKSDMSFSSATSSSIVVRTIRTKTPGLRHIYVKCLNDNPDGFEGTVALTLTIEPNGTISDIYIKFSTTNFEEFDEQIRDAVGRWKFDFKNKAANEKAPDSSVTVTVPFDFYLKLVD